MRVVGYVRVSSQEQAQRGLSLPEQKRAITRWAKVQGYKLVEIFEDEAISGANGVEDREGLPLALNALQAHEADALVITKLDRLARSLTTQEVTLARVWQLGASVFSVETGEVPQDDPDDPLRTAARQMAGVFAELEKNMIRKRMRDGRRAKAERGGRYLHGAPPFGWRADPETHELIEEAAEQATMARIRELLGQEPKPSLRQIATTLNEEGRPAKRSARWHPETLRQVISRL
ncbi:MAG: recombinase family protein [Chloroflexota bacterium]|nr:recombinase family protein [Chloroflexota bacterium]